MKVTLGALFGSAALVSSTLLFAAPAQAITIDPIFSSGCSNCDLPEADQVSLTTVPGATAAIEAADQQIASQFGGSMTANVVYVGFHGGTDGFLGASVSGSTVYTYTQYVDALTADATAHPGNTILNTAVANLGSGNGAGDRNAFISLNTTDARNLGLTTGAGTSIGVGDQTPQFDSSGNFVGSDNGGTADAVVFLNVDQPLSFTRPIQDVSAGVAFDAETTMEHETDEVLGIGGAGSVLNAANDDPGGYAADFFGVNGDVFGPMDLYRYSAPGTPSFDFTDAFGPGCAFLPPGTCAVAPSPYFSIDGGVTSIDTFNQLFPAIGGDAGDWGIVSTLCPGDEFLGGSGDVQDAFSCNNHTADVTPGTPAFASLAAIGYNPSVPEPAAWALMLMGVGLVGAGLRISRRDQDIAHRTA